MANTADNEDHPDLEAHQILEKKAIKSSGKLKLYIIILAICIILFYLIFTDYLEQHKYEAMFLTEEERAWVPLIYDHLKSLEPDKDKFSSTLGALRGVKADISVLRAEDGSLNGSYASFIEENDFLSVYKKVALEHPVQMALLPLLKNDKCSGDDAPIKCLLVFLLYKGADPNLTDISGCNSLHLSLKFFDVIDILMKAGANALLPNNESNSALLLSSRDADGDTKVLEAMLKETDKTEISKFYLKNIKDLPTARLLLIIKYIDPNYLNENTSSLLIETIYLLYDQEKLVILLRALLERGDINYRPVNKGGDSILKVAIYFGMPYDIIETLVTDSITYKTYFYEEMNVLHVAAMRGNVAAVEILVSKCGMEVDGVCEKRKWSPLFYAVESGKCDCITKLLSLGADKHKKDGNNRSLLQINKDSCVIEALNK